MNKRQFLFCHKLLPFLLVEHTVFFVFVFFFICFFLLQPSNGFIDPEMGRVSYERNGVSRITRNLHFCVSLKIVFGITANGCLMGLASF